jgi:hypothetical protein
VQRLVGERQQKGDPDRVLIAISIQVADPE